MKTIGQKIALIVALSVTAGCSVVEHNTAKKETEGSMKSAESLMATALDGRGSPRAVMSDGVWVNKRSVTVREEQLPAIFRSPVSVSFATRTSTRDIANVVSRETGIRFAFSPDIQQEISLPFFNAGFNSGDDLKSLLDRITSQQNISWKYQDGSVELYRFDTKVFQLAVLPGTTTFNADVSNKNSAGGESSSGAQSISGQTSKYSYKLDFWGGIKNDVKGLVQTGSYSVSETNGTITVTGTPQILASVESYVKNLNAMKMRQVALEVRAYSVEARNGRDFGMSWDAFYANLGKDLTYNLVTPLASNVGLGALSAVLGPNSTSKWANSKAIFNSLSTLGNTSVAAESSQVVLSGESLSITSLRKVGYLSEVQTSNVPNSGTQTSLKQATENEGFAMTLTPNIISGNYVQIAGAIDLSSIDKFSNISSGGQTIQTPDVSTRSLPVRVGLRTGETYIFGLRQNTSSTDDSGILGASSWLTPAGGQHGSKESRKTIVVTVTAHIVNPATR
ncbi:hypothetical protein [Acidovorax carolinensis]|nr:hypothetical protein [Acidovorax carolinensis]